MTKKYKIWCKGKSKNLNFNKSRWIDSGDYILQKYFPTLDHIWQDEESNFEVFWFTGLTDINGVEIYEGDTVVTYPANYRTTLIEHDGFSHPVYFADTNKTLPLKDIVLFKGKVVWEAPEFRILVDKNENGISSVGMRGYWLEVIKN